MPQEFSPAFRRAAKLSERHWAELFDKYDRLDSGHLNVGSVDRLLRAGHRVGRDAEAAAKACACAACERGGVAGNTSSAATRKGDGAGTARQCDKQILNS